MKLNRIITLCAVTAALALSVGSVFAQDNGNGGGNGGQRRNRQGGGNGGGNWDPAQMQQRILDRVRQDLNFTNDTEWSAVQPLVQKVIEARFAARSGMFGRGGRGGPGGGGPGGTAAGQAFPERDALQKAIEDNAPAGQIKDLLAKYRTAQKAKQAKLVEAQDALKQVLTTTQEAQATLSGWLD